MNVKRLSAALAGVSLALIASPAVAAPSSSPNMEPLHLVCGSAEYDIVAPVGESFAAPVEGSTMVAVLKGVDGVLFTGVPESKLSTCLVYVDGQLAFTAQVLFTPQM